jgi:hypothetical protein
MKSLMGVDYKKYVCGLLYLMLSTTSHATDSASKQQHDDLLDTIPKIIDATPTLFPPESGHKIVPITADTQNQSWIDQKQYGFSQWVDHASMKIDDWFGEPDLNNPASATLRILLDSSWDRYEDIEFRPRIRGKIQLPTLEKKLSVVFGDDSLDNELENNIAITNENPNIDSNKHYDHSRNRKDNGSVALRWSEFSKRIPFETDLDLGVRSGDDLYVRVKASKDWQLDNDFYSRVEQIYRYGIDSENYLRTNLELTHARQNEAFISNQFSLIIADDQTDDFSWQNFSFRQHHFFEGNRFNYGIYTGGYYLDHSLKVNSWGPFVSWRQPVWREWFFVQTDLNYLDDDREHRDHYLGALLRLEALF